jgi:hypothetical protein
LVTGRGFLCGGRVRREGKRNEPIAANGRVVVCEVARLAAPEAAWTEAHQHAFGVTPACPRVLTSFPFPR